MTQVYDMTGCSIKKGDWMVIPSGTSGTSPLRFAKVLGLGSGGNLSVGSFQIDPSDKSWFRYPVRPTTLYKADKCWAVGEAALPEGLRTYIASVMGGDTEFFTK